MKNALLAINLVLVAIIVMMACHQKGTIRRERDSPDCQRLCSDYSTSLEPRGMITVQQIAALSGAYAADPGKSLITNGNGQEDALSLVFDLDKVKNFIWLIENATCKARCDTSVKLGLRFYYIKYDRDSIGADSALFKAIGGNNINKHSLAMVPVYHNESDDMWYDFDYRIVGSQGTCNFDQPPVGGKPGAGLLSIQADNHGGLSPPPGRGTYPSLHQ